MSRSRTFPPTTLLLFLAIAATAQPALAARVYVATNGVDSGNCGTKSDPCRSITQGIHQAGLGDTVSVGPGSYGDLDNDGTLGETGEEPVASCPGGDCMIKVDKPVAVVSQTGAFATIVDSGGYGGTIAAFGVTAAGAAVGRRNRGFTVQIHNAGSTGIMADLGADGTVIAGNILNGDVQTFGVYVAGASGVQLLDNHAVMEPDGAGFVVEGNDSVLTGNTASGAQYGIALVSSSGATLSGNVTSGNLIGLYAAAATGNTAVKHETLGNFGFGVYAPGGGSELSITDSNIFGNFPSTNCGLEAVGGPTTAMSVFWGAPGGPGADPADLACNIVGGAADSPLAKAVKVKPKLLR